MKQRTTKCHMRQMARSDIPDLVRMDREGTTDPWDEEVFQVFRANRDNPSWVMAIDGQPIGYAITMLAPKVVCVQRFVIHPAVRRRGWGTSLFQALERMTSRDGGVSHDAIRVMVDERHDETIEFLRSMSGYYAYGVARDYYGHGRDAYEFIFDPDGEYDGLPELWSWKAKSRETWPISRGKYFGD